MRSHIDEYASCPVEDEMLERMTALRDFGPVRQRSSAARKSVNDCLDCTLGVCRGRIETEDGLRRRSIDLLVGADRETERVFEIGNNFFDPLALGRVRIEQQQPAVCAIPSTHVRDNELLVIRDLDDGTRKPQPVLFAQNQSSAESLLHIDFKSGKGHVPAATLLRADRVAALPFGFSRPSRRTAESSGGKSNDCLNSPSNRTGRTSMSHGSLQICRRRESPR